MASYRLTGAGLVLVSLAACGGGGSSESRPGSGNAQPARPSGSGACALLMQDEVDGLFGVSVGPGSSETLEGGGDLLCSWPATEEPALLVQISPTSTDILAAVDLGDGFRSTEISGMSGPAAAAFEEADRERAVAVIALSAGEHTITVSPIGLGVMEGTPRFERLKALVDQMATRL